MAEVTGSLESPRAKIPALDAAQLGHLADAHHEQVGGHLHRGLVGQRDDHALETVATGQLDDLAAGDQLDVGFGQALLREGVGAEGLAAMDDRHVGHRAQRERRVERRVATADHDHVAAAISSIGGSR